MKTLISLAFLTVFVSNIAFADSVAYLHKGDVAPFQGALLDDERSKILANELKDYDRIKLINISLNKSIDLYKANEIEYKAEIVDLKSVNLNLIQAVDKANTNNTWRNVLYFSLGVIATGLVVHATR